MQAIIHLLITEESSPSYLLTVKKQMSRQKSLFMALDLFLLFILSFEKVHSHFAFSWNEYLEMTLEEEKKSNDLEIILFGYSICLSSVNGIECWSGIHHQKSYLLIAFSIESRKESMEFLYKWKILNRDINTGRDCPIDENTGFSNTLLPKSF